MSKLTWDAIGEHEYETGVRQGVLWPFKNNAYQHGVAWNGLSTVTESPSGAEETKIYADDIKYLGLRSVEEFGGTIEAYMFPDEFYECNGMAAPVEGVVFGQQKRIPFAFSYRTAIGNDTEYESYGYKIHLIYGATVSPSQRTYTTMNDSPEANTMSWEFTTTAVAVEGYKPVSSLEIKSTVVDDEKLKTLENMIYGTDSEESTLPMPKKVLEIFQGSTVVTPVTPVTGD